MSHREQTQEAQHPRELLYAAAKVWEQRAKTIKRKET